MKVTDRERPLVFDCAGISLLGVLHPAASETAARGVLLVVGGPQYRVGSHRQFVLLSRDLAASGVPVLRFDYRGMGDSGGELRDFADITDDIHAAIDAFQKALPALREVVIWGLCDAASAAAFYGWRDPRVSGLVLLNPWIRTAAGEARTVLRHYYLQRLMSRHFWRKLLSGRLRLGRSLGEMRALRRRASGDGAASEPGGLDLPGHMLHGLQQFNGSVLLILSGNDLVAREFLDHCANSPAWSDWLRASSVTRKDLAEADHTFSRKAWRDQVSAWTRQWVRAS
jgi:exosortase A-associated hydrolase 1